MSKKTDKATQAPEASEGSSKGGAAGTPHLNPRAAAYAEITARHDENRQEQLKRGDEEAEVTPVADNTPSIEDAPNQPEVRMEPAVEPVAEAPAKVRVKIDGEEMDVDAKDVEEFGGIKGYQIAKAAEKRLKEAAAVKEEATKAVAIAKQIIEAEQNAQRQHQSRVQQDQLQQSQTEEAKALARAIQFGTEDEQAAAILKLRTPQAPQIDQNQLQSVLEAKLEQRFAAKTFLSEYGDVLKDPDVYQFAAMKETSLLQQQGNPGDWSKFYKDLGEGLRKRFGVPAQQTMQERKEQKAENANVINLPTASGKKPEVTEKKPPTVDEVIASMRKARGQRND